MSFIETLFGTTVKPQATLWIAKDHQRPGDRIAMLVEGRGIVGEMPHAPAEGDLLQYLSRDGLRIYVIHNVVAVRKLLTDTTEKFQADVQPFKKGILR